MDYRLVERPAFTVAGISLRTSNRRPREIAGLWEAFFKRNIRAAVAGRVSDAIYSLYTDYESDYRGEYTLLLGCELKGAAGLAAEHDVRRVPEATYAVFTARGEQPKALIEVWSAIWASDLKRRYTTDFDYYPPEPGGAVEVYVALRT